jgi:hypothetical protein
LIPLLFPAASTFAETNNSSSRAAVKNFIIKVKAKMQQVSSTQWDDWELFGLLQCATQSPGPADTIGT